MTYVEQMSRLKEQPLSDAVMSAAGTDVVVVAYSITVCTEPTPVEL